MEEYRKYEPFFGSWNIVKKIGEGAFGKVFEVERSDFGKSFKSALKVVSIPANSSEVDSLISEGMDEESVKKYYNSMAGEMINEFELLAKLQGNSYIVSYDDHMIKERENGIGYDILIRMELLTPISTKLSSGEMPQEDVLQMGIDICRALEVCEKFHIIHRDIKPENIFLSEIGTYKLGDFGVARTMESENHVLSRKGTQSYMAPELYKEEETNETADIYSLGIVLYRLCNKNRLPFIPPFPAEVTYTDRETALRKRIMGDPMPKPSEAVDEFASIILKACAYRTQDRYQNARQMRKEMENLQRKLNGEEVTMPSPQNPGPSLHMESSMSVQGSSFGSQNSSAYYGMNQSVATGRNGNRVMPGGGMPVNGMNSNGVVPVNGMRPNGMPVNGTRPNGAPVNGGRANGMPVNGGRPVNGMPANGARPVNGMPVNGSRPNGVPVAPGRPNGGAPVNGMRPNGMPVNGGRPNGMPVNGMNPNGVAPANGGRPVNGMPVNGARPVNGMPVNGMNPSGGTMVNGSRQNGINPKGAVPVNGGRPNAVPVNGARGNGMPVNGMRPNVGTSVNGMNPNGGTPVNGMRPNGMPTNGMGPKGAVPVNGGRPNAVPVNGGRQNGGTPDKSGHPGGMPQKTPSWGKEQK